MRRFVFSLTLCVASAATPPSQVATFDDAQAFLTIYCRGCHEGKSSVGGFNLQRISTIESFRTDAGKWSKAAARVKAGEMPPKGSPTASLDVREQFTNWVGKTLRAEACAAGITPGTALTRRLNRAEYTATIRDLLDVHMDVGQALPVDGAGGEGFDNAAETLFLSPLHSEKYMDVARFAVDFAAKEFKSRSKILVAKPGSGVTEQQAAREIIRNFLPQAFRRPVSPEEVNQYLALYHAARKQGRAYEPSVFFALRASLVSPNFLYRLESPNLTGETRLLDHYALASRLSYFLWGSMPDELLFDVAAAGRMQDPEVLKALVRRMISNDRSLQFAERFVEQWLRTGELSTDKQPDAKLFPTYAASEELRSDIRFEPILFFRELFVRDMSLLNLIDSKFTVGTRNLGRHYGVELPVNKGAAQQPQWVEIPEGSNRGGLLGMAAVLIASSHPYRTSPVLRGAWILDSLLGAPPPPPPPDVPPLEEHKEGAAPKTVRERLMQHRANPACASCHDRIDPLGFALENYDAVGRWRTEDGGKPIDNSAELIDGTKFRGPAGLKAALLDRKDLLIRNLATKMLGYALGRGLTLRDSCAVDQIVAKVKENNYSAQALLEAIVLSVPFRYQAAAAVPKENAKQ